MSLLSIAERVQQDDVTIVDARASTDCQAGAGSTTAATIAVAGDLEGLLALEAEWRALERRTATSCQVFQGFDWCCAWARARAGDPRMQPRIVTARVDGRLVLVWPLMQQATGPLNVLRWFSDPYSQYGDVLVDPAGDVEAALEAAWQHIVALPGIDAIRLRHVRADAAAADFLTRHCRATGKADCAPYLDLTAYGNEKAYEGRYNKAQRRRRKRIRQELEQRGELDFRLLICGAEFDNLIERTVTEKRAWLAERGLHSRPLADPGITDFIRRLAAGCDLQVVLSVLSAGGKAVAFEVGLRYAQRHFGYITAHDTCLTDASPARLHMDMSQRRAITDGMRVFDLMVPGDPHKLSWSSASVAVYDFYVPLSLLGRLYGRVYLEALRPLLRRAYLAAPPALRRRFARIIGC